MDYFRNHIYSLDLLFVKLHSIETYFSPSTTAAFFLLLLISIESKSRNLVHEYNEFRVLPSDGLNWALGWTDG